MQTTPAGAGEDYRSVASSPLLSAVQAEAHSIRRLSLATKDLVYDAQTQKIYGSVPSRAGSIGNSITQINPATGDIGPSVFIGSEPGRLAISDNGQYIYAYLEGAVAVRRFDVAAQTSGLQFNLRTTPTTDPHSLFDAAVVPGRPESIAVSGGGTVAVYDNDVRRPQSISNFLDSYIEFSASANTLYGVTGSSPINLQRISVTANGVSVSSATQVGSSGDFRFANGRIYLPNGQVRDVNSGALLGTFPDVGNGLVVPDPAVGRVYYLTSTTQSQTWAIKAYDINTFVLLGSLEISGVSNTPTSLVRWGANGLAFRTGVTDFSASARDEVFLIQTSLIPSSEPIPTPTPTPSPTPSPSPTPEASIRQVPLPSNDIVFDPGRQTIYASVPSVAGGNGNSITAIDPATGVTGASVFIGSEPSKLALTDDGQHLYVSLTGAATVGRLDLATQTAGPQFSLGGSDFDGPFYARDIVPLQGQPGAVAVSRYALGTSPDFKGVAIYDNGVQRPTTTPGHTGSDYIEPSASVSTLYGSSYSAGSAGIQKLTVNSSGVTVAKTTQAGGSSGGDIRVAGGLVFTPFGKLVNPESGTLIGTFTGISSGSYSPLVAPDPANGRIYFLTSGSSGGNNAVLRAYDLNTFLPIGSLVIPNVVGTPSSLTRWGTNGLAFRTSGSSSGGAAPPTNSQIFLIQTSLVNPNEPVVEPTPTPTPSPSPSPTPPSVEVRQVSLATNDIVYDSLGKRIYASVPGSAGVNGNSITPIDPAAGTVGASVFIGSEPLDLALSDNGQYLYAGLDGAGAVRRFDLATQTPGLQFSLGTLQSIPLKAFDIAVLPGKAESVAVSRWYGVYSSAGVAIYDHDIQRPVVGGGNYSGSYIEFATTANILYSYETHNSTTDLQKIGITPQGVTVTSITPAGGTGDFRVADGRVYMPTGHVIDTETGRLVGKFAGPSYNSLVVPDPAKGRVYFLFGSDPYGSTPVTLTLRAYDINTFLPLASVQIPGVAAAPSSLLRWGADGLAFRTGRNTSAPPGTDNKVFLIRTSLVPPADVPPPKPRNLLWQHQTSGLIGEWLMNGTTMTQAPLFTPSQVSDTNWKIVGTGDFDGDSKPDLVWQNRASGDIGVWPMNGISRLGPPLFFTPSQVTDTDWKIVGVGDFNADLKPDLVWQHQTTGQIGVWAMDGTNLTEPVFFTPGQVSDTNWKVVGVGDFNGDDKPDLVWQHQTNGLIGVWLMDGTTRLDMPLFAPSQVSDTSWKIVGVGDFNADAKSDLVWQHQTTGQIGVWLMDGTTRLQAPLFTPSQVSDTNWKIVGVR